MSELEKLSLANIANGVAQELFARELDAVLANVADVNTSSIAKRKITLSFVFTPSDTRDASSVVVQSTSKLSAVRPAAAMVFIGTQNGKSVAFHHNPNQLNMDFDQPKPTIVPMKGSKT